MTDQTNPTIAGSPAPNTRWIMSRADLPPATAPARFRITLPGEEPREVIASKRRRQVLECLMAGPVFCASPVRLSDGVMRIKEELGIHIYTDWFSDSKDGSRYGTYRLVDHVEYLGEVREMGEAA